MYMSAGVGVWCMSINTVDSTNSVESTETTPHEESAAERRCGITLSPPRDPMY